MPQNVSINVKLNSDGTGLVVADLKQVSTAFDQLGGRIDGAGRKSDVFGKKARSNTTALTTLRSAALSAGSALATIGLGLGLGNSVRTIADFSQEISTLGAVTGASSEQLAALRAETKNLGATTRFSATQAAEGATFLARAGFDVNETLESLSDTLLLAQSGALDLGRAADITSNVLQGFQLEASQAARVVDVLSLGANSANTNVEQLGSAMSFVAPVAKVTGTSLEATTASISALSDAGIQGERAGTALRQIMVKLTEAGGDLSVETNGLIPVIQTLADKNLSLAEATDLVGARQAASLLVLTNSVGKVKDLTKEYENAEGTAKRVADVMDDNLNGALLAVLSSFEAVTIATGDLGAENNLTELFEGLAFVLRGTAENMDLVVDVATLGAAVFAARYAPAVITAAKSTALATVEQVKYQAALARMAGLSRTAAASQVALGTSMAGVTGALGLLGGPAGLILTAAAAYLIFADNSDRAKKSSQELADELGDLTVKFEEGTKAQRENAALQAQKQLTGIRGQISEAKAEIKDLEQELGRALEGQALNDNEFANRRSGLRIQSFKEDLVELKAALNELERSEALAAGTVQALNDALAGVARTTAETEKESSDLVKTVIELTSAQEGLLDKYLPLRALERDRSTDLKNLNKIMNVLGLSELDRSKAISNLEAAYKKLDPRERARADKLEEIQRLTEAMRTPQEAYNAGIARLNELFPEAERNSEVYRRAVAKLKDDLVDAAEESTLSWEKFGDELQDTFRDSFLAAEGDLESFLDRMEKTLKEAALRLVFDFGTQNTSQGNLFNSISSLFGGGGGNQSGGFISGLSSFFGGGGGSGGLAGIAQGASGPVVGSTGGIGAASGTGAGSASSGGLFSGLGGASSAGIFAGIIAGAIDIKNAEANGYTAGDVFLGKPNADRLNNSFLGKYQPGILNPFTAINKGLPGLNKIISGLGGDGKRRSNTGILVGPHVGQGDVASEFTQTGASGLRIQAFERRGSQSGAEDLQAAALQIDSVLTDALRGAGLDVDFRNTTLQGIHGDAGHGGVGDFFGAKGFNGTGSLKDAADEFTLAWLKEVNDQLPKRVKQYLSGVDQVAEELVNTVTAAINIDTLLNVDVVKQAHDAIADSNRLLLETYDHLTEETYNANDSLDGTAQSVVTLSDALQQQKAVAFDLAAAYRSVGIELDALLGNTIENIRESVLSEEELYSLRREEIAKLTAELETTNSPEALLALGQKVDSLSNDAFFRQLDDSQRETLSPEFIEFLTAFDETLQAKLNDGLSNLSESERALNEAVSAQASNEQSSQNFLEAAGQQLEAAIVFQQAVAQFVDQGGFGGGGFGALVSANEVGL